MQEAFDPYSAWLAIPRSQRPANHYDLLGIFRFESNPQSIEQAFERQMARVTCHLQGPLAPHATQLIGELTLAKYCLLDPQQRETYNAQLSQSSPSSQSPLANLPPHAAPPEPPPSETSPAAPPQYGPSSQGPPANQPTSNPMASFTPPTTGSPPQPSTAEKPSKKLRRSIGQRLNQHTGIELLKIITGGVAGVLIALLILRYMLPGNSSQSEANSQQSSANDRPTNNPTYPAADQHVSQTPSRTISPTTVQPSDTALVEPVEPQGESIPTQDLVTAARASLLGKLETASAQDLLHASSSNSDASLDYVLLRAAADKAAATGDFETAFSSLEALAQQFQIDRLAFESEILATFLQSSEDELPIIALTQRALALTQRANEANRPSLALRVAQFALLFARESGSRTLIRQATLLVLESQTLAPSLPFAPVPTNQNSLARHRRPAVHNRWPIPTAAEQETVEELIREVYAEDFRAAESPALRLSLAHKLTNEALGTYDNPPARYELTVQALGLYVELGKLTPALELLQQLNRTHAIDIHARQAEAVAALLPNLETAGGLRQAHSQLTSLIQAAAHADQYEAAYALLDATFQAAAIFEHEELLAELETLRLNVETAEAQWKVAEQAREVLQIKPTDPESNFSLGRYLCFTRGKWEQGIPYLALGSNADSRWAAQLELTIAAASVELKQVGDAWWECQSSLGEPELTATRQRAALWYSVAALELTGISKTTAEQRAREVGSIRDSYPLVGSRFMARSLALQPIASHGVGANTASELAVERGLDWLANHQIFDGSWDFTFHGPICEGRCENTGSFYAPYASTGLTLLPLLAAGSTHQYGPYQENVAAALEFLLENMTVNGSQVSWLDGRGMYSHAVCTLAITELYLMTRDPQLEVPVEAAIRFLYTTQDSASGGWNIVPGKPNDLSITGWALMALKTAHLAEFETPDETVRAIRLMVEPENEEQDPDEEEQDDLPASKPAPDPREVATMQFCRMHLDWHRDTPTMIEGYALLAETPPDLSSLYYDFFAMQVMRLYREETWSRWHVILRDQLIATQEQTGHAAGSWHFPQDQGGVRSLPMLYGDIGAADGGRLYSTVMSLLILQTYHRQSGLNL